MKGDLVDLRDAFFKRLVEIAKEDSRIVVLDSDVSTSTKSQGFHKVYPERFIELGVAEQGMMGTAAGVSCCGLVPFACCYAVFATGRVFDTVRVSIAYTKLNVKIIATHSGISVGMDGPTHHAIEDIGLMRTLPNMTIISPSDSIETERVVDFLVKSKGPCYVRLLRVKVPTLFDENYKFEPGKGVLLHNGKDVTLVSTGIMVKEALRAKDELEKKGISVRLINIHTIKPIDKEIIVKAAMETKGLVSCEDHNIYGGLGSAVAEVLAEEHPARLVRVGVRDCFAESAVPEDLFEKYGLNYKAIVTAAEKIIK